MSDRYHKIRTAHKVHILSWVLALERSGSVPCHFKNCKFMSITVEEIAHHYAYFQCENVPPFECKLCGQCSDNEAKILYHMIYTHSYTATPEELSIVNDFFNIPIKKEVTPVLRRAWYIFLENRGYLKCFQKMCLFVPESVEEMEEHYLHYCMETVWSDLKFSCRTCQGRFFSEEKLTSHVIDAHKSVEPLKPPVTKSRLSELELQKTWGDAIVVYKQAKCPVEQCKFVSNSVSVLEKHYKYCNGQKNFYVECPTCNYWLQSEGKLIEHRKCIHKDTETILVKQEQFELEPEPAEGDDVSIVISYEQNNDTVKIEQVDDVSDPLSSEVSKEISVKKYERVAINCKVERNIGESHNQPNSITNTKAQINKNSQSIDWRPTREMSCIQFPQDIVDTNYHTLDILNVNTSTYGKMLNEGVMENPRLSVKSFASNKRKLLVDHFLRTSNSSQQKSEIMGSTTHKKSENVSGSCSQWKPENTVKLTTLEMVAHEMLRETSNQPTVPVQIKVENVDWTVNVPEQVISSCPSKDNFPTSEEELVNALRKQSLKLLEIVAKKTSIRADIKKVVDFNSKNFLPFKTSVKTCGKKTNFNSNSKEGIAPKAIVPRKSIKKKITSENRINIKNSCIEKYNENISSSSSKQELENSVGFSENLPERDIKMDLDYMDEETSNKNTKLPSKLTDENGLIDCPITNGISIFLKSDVNNFYNENEEINGTNSEGDSNEEHINCDSDCSSQSLDLIPNNTSLNVDYQSSATNDTAHSFDTNHNCNGVSNHSHCHAMDSNAETGILIKVENELENQEDKPINIDFESNIEFESKNDPAPSVDNNFISRENKMEEISQNQLPRDPCTGAVTSKQMSLLDQANAPLVETHTKIESETVLNASDISNNDFNSDRKHYIFIENYTNDDKNCSFGPLVFKNDSKNVIDFPKIKDEKLTSSNENLSVNSSCDDGNSEKVFYINMSSDVSINDLPLDEKCGIFIDKGDQISSTNLSDYKNNSQNKIDSSIKKNEEFDHTSDMLFDNSSCDDKNSILKGSIVSLHESNDEQNVIVSDSGSRKCIQRSKSMPHLSKTNSTKGNFKGFTEDLLSKSNYEKFISICNKLKLLDSKLSSKNLSNVEHYERKRSYSMASLGRVANHDSIPKTLKANQEMAKHSNTTKREHISSVPGKHKIASLTENESSLIDPCTMSKHTSEEFSVLPMSIRNKISLFELNEPSLIDIDEEKMIKEEPYECLFQDINAMPPNSVSLSTEEDAFNENLTFGEISYFKTRSGIVENLLVEKTDNKELIDQEIIESSNHRSAFENIGSCNKIFSSDTDNFKVNLMLDSNRRVYGGSKKTLSSLLLPTDVQTTKIKLENYPGSKESNIYELFSDVVDYSSDVDNQNNDLGYVSSSSIYESFSLKNTSDSHNNSYCIDPVGYKSLSDDCFNLNFISYSPKLRKYSNRKPIAKKYENVFRDNKSSNSEVENKTYQNCSMDFKKSECESIINEEEPVESCSVHSNVYELSDSGIIKNSEAVDEFMQRNESPQLLEEDFLFLSVRGGYENNEHLSFDSSVISYSDINCSSVYEKSFLPCYPCATISTSYKSIGSQYNRNEHLYYKDKLIEGNVDKTIYSPHHGQIEHATGNVCRKTYEKKSNNNNLNTILSESSSKGIGEFEKKDLEKEKPTDETLPLVRQSRRERPPKGYYKKMSNFTDVSSAIATHDKELTTRLCQMLVKEESLLPNKISRSKSCDIPSFYIKRGEKRKRNESDSEIHSEGLNTPNKVAFLDEHSGESKSQHLKGLVSEINPRKKRGRPRKSDTSDNSSLQGNISSENSSIVLSNKSASKFTKEQVSKSLEAISSKTIKCAPLPEDTLKLVTTFQPTVPQQNFVVLVAVSENDVKLKSQDLEQSHTQVTLSTSQVSSNSSSSQVALMDSNSSSTQVALMDSNSSSSQVALMDSSANLLILPPSTGESSTLPSDQPLHNNNLISNSNPVSSQSRAKKCSNNNSGNGSDGPRKRGRPRKSSVVNIESPEQSTSTIVYNNIETSLTLSESMPQPNSVVGSQEHIVNNSSNISPTFRLSGIHSVNNHDSSLKTYSSRKNSIDIIFTSASDRNPTSLNPAIFLPSNNSSIISTQEQVINNSSSRISSSEHTVEPVISLHEENNFSFQTEVPHDKNPIAFEEETNKPESELSSSSALNATNKSSDDNLSQENNHLSETQAESFPHSEAIFFENSANMSLNQSSIQQVKKANNHSCEYESTSPKKRGRPKKKSIHTVANLESVTCCNDNVSSSLNNVQNSDSSSVEQTTGKSSFLMNIDLINIDTTLETMCPIKGETPLERPKKKDVTNSNIDTLDSGSLNDRGLIMNDKFNSLQNVACNTDEDAIKKDPSTEDDDILESKSIKSEEESIEELEINPSYTPEAMLVPKKRGRPRKSFNVSQKLLEKSDSKNSIKDGVRVREVHNTNSIEIKALLKNDALRIEEIELPVKGGRNKKKLDGFDGSTSMTSSGREATSVERITSQDVMEAEPRKLNKVSENLEAITKVEHSNENVEGISVLPKKRGRPKNHVEVSEKFRSKPESNSPSIEKNAKPTEKFYQSPASIMSNRNLCDTEEILDDSESFETCFKEDTKDKSLIEKNIIIQKKRGRPKKNLDVFETSISLKKSDEQIKEGVNDCFSFKGFNISEKVVEILKTPTDSEKLLHVSEADHSQSDGSNLLPKKRGRPKKKMNVSNKSMSKIDSDNTSKEATNASFIDDCNVLPGRKEQPNTIDNGSVKKEGVLESLDKQFKEENVKNTSLNEGGTPFAKRRGRRKKILEPSEVSSHDEENKDKKSDGFSFSDSTFIQKSEQSPIIAVNSYHKSENTSGDDRSHGEEVIKNISPIESHSLLPKKRGRPQKSLDIMDKSVYMTESDKSSKELEFKSTPFVENEISLSKQRGRPKRHPDVSDTMMLPGHIKSLTKIKSEGFEHSTPIIRKRGRPKKSLDLTDFDKSSENIGDITLARSPAIQTGITTSEGMLDNSVNADSYSDNTSFIDSSFATLGQSVSINEESASNVSINDSSLVIKKKRGRPKKNPMPVSNSNVIVNASMDHEKRLSPESSDQKFEKSSQQGETNHLLNPGLSNNPFPVLIKRKVGRPRKTERTVQESYDALDSSMRSFDSNDLSSSSPFVPSENGRVCRKRQLLDYSNLHVDKDNHDSEESTAVKKKCKDGVVRKWEDYEHSNNGDIADVSLTMPHSWKRKDLGDRIYAGSVLKNPNAQVTCAVCKKTMTCLEYKKIHLAEHNFIAWLEGEEPLPVDDMNAMVVVLNRGKKHNPKHIFRCSVCNEGKRSAAGYFSHIQFCGKTESEKEKLLVSCHVCGRVMMPSSISAHFYQAHHQPKEQATAEIADEKSTSETTRKAAIKCLGKIADYAEEESRSKHKYRDAALDFNEYDDEETDEYRELSLLYIPIRRRTSKNMKFRWKQKEKQGEPLKCTLPSCNYTSMMYVEMVGHSKTCDLMGFSCIKCNFSCGTEDEMRDHVRECNPPIALSRSDSSDSDDADKTASISYLKSEEMKLSFDKSRGHFFKPALSCMKELSKTLFSRCPLYPEFKASAEQWQGISNEKSRKYISETRKSLKVDFASQMEEMDLFESKISPDGVGFGFTGGPIWGMAWCPGEGEQFLATSPHISMEYSFQVGSTHTGPGMVQIWSLGHINNSVKSTVECMQFSFGICHEERGAWDLAWCPSGGRSDDRLGLLALASLSGSIPIFAVPQPKTLPLKTTRFFKAEPVLKLELNSNERWQCSAISWSKIKPYRIITAGFVNGIVAVWDLSIQSKLLRPNSKILHPFKVFQAHRSFITGVCLSPESEEYLATSSFDKSFKFWDLRDTTSPLSVTKRGLFTGIEWLRHWMMAVTSFDIAYTLSQTTISLNPIRDFMQSSLQVITSTNSTSWSVSTNDWLNCIASSYDNGQAMVTFALKHVICNYKDKKKFSKVVVQSTLEELPQTENGASSIPDSTAQSKENLSLTEYENASKKFGLKIKVDTRVREFGIPDRLVENTNEGELDVYPLNSINKISWNPNEESFCYLAMGYQSGFLMALKLILPPVDQSVIDLFSARAEPQSSEPS